MLAQPGRLSRARPPSPTLGELVDRRVDELRAFNHQQQLRHALTVSRAEAADDDAAADGGAGVAEAVAARQRAHSYRLYTDRLISIGLHHEAELRRQWVDMEAQARAINRSAERAARKDCKDSVRELVAYARAGRLLEAREAAKEAAQHLDEANEARSSRREVYADPAVHLPLSRLQRRQRRAAQARQADAAASSSSDGVAAVAPFYRQPLFDPTPNAREFDAHTLHSTLYQHMAGAATITRGADTAAVGESLALPHVVEQWSRKMEEEAQQQLLELHHHTQQPHSTRNRHLHHLHQADAAHAREWKPAAHMLGTQKQRAHTQPALGEANEEVEEEKEQLEDRSTAAPSHAAAHLMGTAMGRHPGLAPCAVFDAARTLPPPPLPAAHPLPGRPTTCGVEVVGVATDACVSAAPSACAARSGRSALLSQAFGSALLRDVRLFTVQAAAAEEAKAAAERLQVAEEERRMKEQWMEDELAETRERERRRLLDDTKRATPATLPPCDSAPSSRSATVAALPANSAAAAPHRRRSSCTTTASAQAATKRATTAMRRKSTTSVDSALPIPLTTAAAATTASSSSASSSSLSFVHSLPGLARLDERVRPPSTVGLDVNGSHSSLSSSSSASASQRCSTASSPSASSAPSSRSSLFSQHFPVAQLRSRWQSGAGMSGKEHLARRFSLVVPADALPHQGRGQSTRRSEVASYHLAAMLPNAAATHTTSSSPSLVATNSSHDPLHSPYLQLQRQQRRHATEAVYDTVKRWLEEQEESKQRSSSTADDGGRGRAQPSVGFSDDDGLSPFSSLLLHPPYSPRTLRRDGCMRQQLPLPVQSSAVFAWLKAHRIPPRRPIDPSSEVQYRQIFNEIDRDHSGLLDTEELLSALRSTHGLSMSEEELCVLLSAMDIPYSGSLSFTQFVSQFASMDEWESLFKVWARRKEERQRQQRVRAQQQQQQLTATTPHSERPATPRKGSARASSARSSTRRPASVHRALPSSRRPPLPSLPLPLPPSSPRPGSATAAPSSSAGPPASTAALRSPSTLPSPAASGLAEGAVDAVSAAALDVDVLVPFLLWVPAFHRLQLLESLMQLQLTAEEEAAVRSLASSTSAALSAPVESSASLASASLASAAGGVGGASDGVGLSLLDLWRVTRTQVRRKRVEAEKAEVQRLLQMKRAQQQATVTGSGSHQAQLQRPATAGPRRLPSAGARLGANADDDDERVSGIWRELQEERERRLEEKRRWREQQPTAPHREQEEGGGGRGETEDGSGLELPSRGRQQRLLSPPRKGCDGCEERAMAVFRQFTDCRPSPSALRTAVRTGSSLRQLPSSSRAG